MKIRMNKTVPVNPTGFGATEVYAEGKEYNTTVRLGTALITSGDAVLVTKMVKSGAPENKRLSKPVTKKRGRPPKGKK